MLRKVGEGSGQPRAKDKEGHRHWCLLEGSTLLCYQDEEVRGMALSARPGQLVCGAASWWSSLPSPPSSSPLRMRGSSSFRALLT